MPQGVAFQSAPVVRPAYDVAISFLVQDASIAKALNDELEAAGFHVFFFPRRQEELAGTNGMETMRAPFLGARVNAVLFREPWGETPWTRVENGAISERCFRDGWSSLLFVQLDKTSPLPKWLPTTHIRFCFEDYGLNQLVGAIKLRVQEQGGEIKPLDAIGKAKRVKREAEYQADRENMMGDRRWIEDVVHRSLRETMGQILRLASKANSELGFNIQCGTSDYHGCVLRSEWVSMVVGWHQPIFNRVNDHKSDHCYLSATEFSGAVLLPGERGLILHQPKQVKETRFKVDVSQDRKLVWKVASKKSEIEPSKLADMIAQLFLDLISRMNRGEIERPFL
jgi:hypothetical protein